jgi:hypothetical protein
VKSRARGLRRIVLPAAAVAVLISAGLALTLARHPGTATTGHPSGPARRLQPQVPARAPGGRVPGVSRAGLARLRWHDFHGIELPSSPVAGPHVTRAGLASGFADTPLGAVLAALNIAVRANAQWGPAIFVPEIRDQVTGPAAAVLLDSCEAAYTRASQAAHITGGRPLGNAYATEQAFRLAAYTPAAATVDLVSAGPGTQGVIVRAVTRVGVAWAAGDWRVIAPPGGDWGNAAAPLASPAGYTTFPGQG